MKTIKKMIRNLLLFVILIVITFYIIFKDQDITEIVNVLENVNIKYVLIGILCMFGYLTFEAVNIGRTLKVLGEKSNLFKNIKYAMIGFFFSSITPAASGGQPMQIYYMYKDGINVANSTLVLLINLTCMQIATISMALFSAIVNYEYMNIAMKGFFIVGILLNLSALTLLIISIVSPKMTNGIINFVIKILKFFKVKKIEEKKEKIQNELMKYQDGAKYIKKNKKLMLKTLVTTFTQFLVYYSISYWVYKAFGYNEYNIFEIITLQSVLFGTVSGIPSPGSVGVSEGGYLAIFGHVFEEKTLNGAMLLNRGINFYLYVIISCIVVIINAIRTKKIVTNENEIQKS